MNIKLIRNQSDVWTILLRGLAVSVLLSLLVLPWLWAVNEMRWNLAIDWSEILWAVKNSSVQAAWSAAVAICLGVPGALGLLYFPQQAKMRRILNVLFLGPNFLPAIFLLISCLQLFGRSLFGVFGIALVHGFMNAGLVAVGIAGKSDEDLGSTCELSLVMGAPRLLFLRSIWLPLVAHDILKYYLMVFVFSFGALTVPLVLGGSSGTTLEVLILEKLRVEGSLPSATVLAFAQGILLLLLSQAFGIFSQFRQKAKVRVGEGIESGHGIFPKTYSWLPGLSFGFFGSFVLGGGLILGATEILLQKPSLLNEILFDSDFQLAVVGTMAVMGLMYLAVHFTLAFSLMILPRLSFLRWTEHLSFQSAAFVGFGLMLFGRQVGVEFWVSFPISMIVLLWPSFLRLGWLSRMEQLKATYVEGMIMGASHVSTVRHLALPLSAAARNRLALIGSIWAGGDFIISGMNANSPKLLALMMGQLMGSYRLNLSCVYAIILILIMGTMSFIFTKVYDVGH